MSHYDITKCALRQSGFSTLGLHRNEYIKLTIQEAGVFINNKTKIKPDITADMWFSEFLAHTKENPLSVNKWDQLLFFFLVIHSGDLMLDHPPNSINLNYPQPHDFHVCSDLTCPVLVIMVVRLSCSGQPGHSWFCLVEASLVLLVLLLNFFSTAVRLLWLAALASPWLVLVVGKVFLVLHAQSLRLLDEGTLFNLRKESERNRMQGS